MHFIKTLKCLKHLLHPSSCRYGNDQIWNDAKFKSLRCAFRIKRVEKRASVRSRARQFMVRTRALKVTWDLTTFTACNPFQNSVMHSTVPLFAKLFAKVLISLWASLCSRTPCDFSFQSTFAFAPVFSFSILESNANSSTTRFWALHSLRIKFSLFPTHHFLISFFSCF